MGVSLFYSLPTFPFHDVGRCDKFSGEKRFFLVPLSSNTPPRQPRGGVITTGGGFFVVKCPAHAGNPPAEVCGAHVPIREAADTVPHNGGSGFMGRGRGGGREGKG